MRIRMRWLCITSVVTLGLLVLSVHGKPAEHVTEERREYYQKTSKVMETPIVYATNGGTHSSYTSSNDALSSSWAQNHMDEVRKMADRLRWEYNQKAHAGGGRKGGHRMRHGYSSVSMADFPSFSGKSKEELDALARQMTEQMISDMRSGKLLYSQIAKPNWFESQAAQQLESMSQTRDHQTQDVYGAEDFRHVVPQTIGGGYHRTEEKKHYEYSSSHQGGYQPIVPTYASEIADLNRQEAHSSVAYPTTVTIIGGNRYVTKQNCTTSSTQGSRMPYFTNLRTHTSTSDKDIHNILEHGREIPIVMDQSVYNNEDRTYNKQQEQQSVPVYPGSYFTGSHYESQHNENRDQSIPVQSQVQSGQTSETRESSHYNRQYHPTIIGGSSQTIQSSSTSFEERENQQIPVVIPSQQTVTSSSESHSQTETQRQAPVIIPSAASHRETSSYESVREHRPAPVPLPASQRHSIYRHLEKQSEVIPDYKPVVTIDSQTIESVNQELNKFYQQRPTTIARTEETEHIEQGKQMQQIPVAPEITITIHEQDHIEDQSNKMIQPVRPTIATSQQTTTNTQQSNIQYRPSYPAYGSQFNRNDTEYHQQHQSRYPQQIITGTSFQKQEEDNHYTREQHQQIPVYGQTTQNTEEMSTSEIYRNREQQVPVVVGGSTSYQESQEQHYTRQQPKPAAQTTTYQASEEEHHTDQRQQSVVPQITTYQENIEDHDKYTNEYRSSQVPVVQQKVEETSEINRTTNQQSQHPIYVSGDRSYQINFEEDSRDSTRYRQHPTGHQTSQITSETEDSRWSSHHQIPKTVQTTQTETETEYEQSSQSRYPQTGHVTSQSTQEVETESQDIRQRPGQTGYTVSTHANETSTYSSSAQADSVQQPVVVAESQETIVEGGSQTGAQVLVQQGQSGANVERNDSTVIFDADKIYFPVDDDVSREQSSQKYNQNRHQSGYGGVISHSEYGSQVNRTVSTGGVGIGYVTHQLTIEQQEEEWRRQQEERRRQQLISTGIFEDSSLNRSSSFGAGGQIQVDVAKLGIHDGDESRLRNGTAHLDTAKYGSSADVSTTSASGKQPGTIISKDRGDQPPQHYEEDYDLNEAEPGIGYYPSEPEVANQILSTTTEYIPRYVAPVLPPNVDKERLEQNQQTTVEVWPTQPDETEVQRTYHKKKTVITQTIPVLLGPNGEIIQQSGSIVGGSQLQGSIVNGTQLLGSIVSGGQVQGTTTSGSSYHVTSSGSYQSQASGGEANLSNGGTNELQRNENEGQAYISQSSSHQSAGGPGSYGSSVYGSESRYTLRPGGEGNLVSEGTNALRRDQNEGQSYMSQSSSHQSAVEPGSYGSSVYGSESRYTMRPGASHSEGTGTTYSSGSGSSSSGGSGSRYTTGSSSSSVSYQDGGSYSQATAYGHHPQQQNEDQDDLGAYAQQLTIGALEIGDQQEQDLTQQFLEDDQQTEDLIQGYEGYQQSHSHGSYSQSADGMEHDGQRQDESSSGYYQSHSSYSSSSSGASSSSNGSSYGGSNAASEQIPAEANDDDIKSSDQGKPGFWRRIGQKAKDLFG